MHPLLQTVTNASDDLQLEAAEALQALLHHDCAQASLRLGHTGIITHNHTSVSTPVKTGDKEGADCWSLLWERGAGLQFRCHACA